MPNIAITIKSLEKKGVLDEITNVISSHGLNISYTHMFIEKNNFGSINLELESTKNINQLIEDINSINSVQSVEIHSSLNDIFGKRIIIFGGGVQVSQVAMGAITEADRHNIRGERISIDTIPLIGENDIVEAAEALTRLPRISALVLAGSLMGAEITKAVSEVKAEHDLVVISLNMPGGITEIADLIVSDPLQAGVMAVMSIADTAIFDIKKLKTNKF
ncbi:hypothetical protein ALNOE001_21450 [Candidatus Methanobinarius endosymbioticus]|uniref:ACT domain-containing protein n=1 Tax=Candidatus Methanobinarius endosymbioticus TaxID=2006182 RepID=A0A366M838_9EURY|nr:hypothetical protein ALNOE001_21450 [Candidatus Methanobinarius endosymbioticus]